MKSRVITGYDVIAGKSWYGVQTWREAYEYRDWRPSVSIYGKDDRPDIIRVDAHWEDWSGILWNPNPPFRTDDEMTARRIAFELSQGKWPDAQQTVIEFADGVEFKAPA